VVSLVFSPDGRTFASGSCGRFNSAGLCVEGEVFLWDVGSSEPYLRLNDTVGFPQGLAFSPDGRRLAANDCGLVEVVGQCVEGAIQLWELPSGRALDELVGHTAFVWNIAFSPDGETLASASADNTIILWDLQSGQPIGQRLTNHGGPVRRLTFSPHGSLLASSGFDNLVFLWDVATGQALGGPLAVHPNNVLGLTFSPDGKTLASADQDGSIVLSDIDFSSWRERACRVANRNLRSEEWELFFGDTAFRVTCPGR
jgi:WD40 repeat protein